MKKTNYFLIILFLFFFLLDPELAPLGLVLAAPLLRNDSENNESSGGILPQQQTPFESPSLSMLSTLNLDNRILTYNEGRQCDLEKKNDSITIPLSVPYNYYTILRHDNKTYVGFGDFHTPTIHIIACGDDGKVLYSSDNFIPLINNSIIFEDFALKSYGKSELCALSMQEPVFPPFNKTVSLLVFDKGNGKIIQNLKISGNVHNLHGDTGLGISKGEVAVVTWIYQPQEQEKYSNIFPKCIYQQR